MIIILVIFRLFLRFFILLIRPLVVVTLRLDKYSFISNILGIFFVIACVKIELLFSYIDEKSIKRAHT